MRATIHISVLLVGFCGVLLRADDGPAPAGTSHECVVQVASDAGRPAWRSVSREACLARAYLAADQPPTTIEMLRRAAGEPLTISDPAPEHCAFIPYNMQLKGR